nr:hypothetical protein Q903MT_gene5926 [Picea sitchensis]
MLLSLLLPMLLPHELIRPFPDTVHEAGNSIQFLLAFLRAVNS